MAITPSDFDYVRELVRQRSAIVIEPGKEYLVESRLTPLARQEGLPSLAELLQALRAQQENGLHRRVVEAMTTNETSFFRDLIPFEAVRTTVLPELMARRAVERQLTIWSGACSSGQEAYSLAMLLSEQGSALQGWGLAIHATDLSDDMVERTRSGIFSQLEVNRGLPAAHMVKYFDREDMAWRAKSPLRSMIQARRMNLIEPWPALPQFDLIFMRNVLIYFAVSTKKEVLCRLRRVLRPDGYLFLGAAETTLGIDDAFERVQIGKAICYRAARR